MSNNLSEIKKKTVSINEYINSLKHPFQEKFLERKQTYNLKKEAIEELKKFVNKCTIVAFSAEWCKDCTANIPILALISETTQLEIRVFGGLKKDPLSHVRKWRIPPSPPEVETFNIDKIPHMIILDKEGRELGRIIENPKEKPTIEEEMLKIVSEKIH